MWLLRIVTIRKLRNVRRAVSIWHRRSVHLAVLPVVHTVLADLVPSRIGLLLLLAVLPFLLPHGLLQSRIRHGLVFRLPSHQERSDECGHTNDANADAHADAGLGSC